LPHIVLHGKTTIEDIFRQLQPIFIKNENTILRTAEQYLERKKQDILIESLAIENGKKQTFLSMISGREDGVVIRLYPNLAVQKTDGVKKVLAELAKQLMAAFQALQVGETNLQDYLK
jgi:hypothetical protein